jgi:hypothetical protein
MSQVCFENVNGRYFARFDLASNFVCRKCVEGHGNPEKEREE